MMEVFVA